MHECKLASELYHSYASHVYLWSYSFHMHIYGDIIEYLCIVVFMCM